MHPKYIVSIVSIKSDISDIPYCLVPENPQKQPCLRSGKELCHLAKRFINFISRSLDRITRTFVTWHWFFSASLFFARLARKCSLQSPISRQHLRMRFAPPFLFSSAICAFDKDNQRLAQTLGTLGQRGGGGEWMGRTASPANTCHAPSAAPWSSCHFFWGRWADTASRRWADAQLEIRQRRTSECWQAD